MAQGGLSIHFGPLAQAKDMHASMTQSPANHQTVINRFKSVCEADDRILAAFVGGSTARGTADAFSDLDLYLVTTDDTFEEFLAQHRAFVQQLGEPVFLVTFNRSNLIFYVLADGVEGEIGIGRASDFGAIHYGPFVVLVDKPGILAGRVFAEPVLNSQEQTENLRRLIDVFWHELSHFITAMGRQQLWWAQGQVEALRAVCVNLARLRYNFGDSEAGDEPYFKIEKHLPVEQLAELRATFGPMERSHLMAACETLVKFYKEQAISLAEAHRLAYPDQLERVMLERLERVSQSLTEGE